MSQGKRMKASKKTLPFRKTATCPASSALLSFRDGTLSPVIAPTVEEHLDSCEFCQAELSLLAHHRPPVQAHKTPEIPKNLRILAEAILCKVKS
jgi:hypothetical protein